MKLSKEQIEHVARLSCLALSPEEIEQLSHDLTSIIGHVEALNEVNTGSVAPTYHINSLTNVFREDEVTPSFDTKELLKGAPSHDDHAFHVPKIIETDG